MKPLDFQTHFLPVQVADRQMWPLADVSARIALGELPSMVVHGKGPVIPLTALPPFAHVSEHDL